VGAVVDDPHRWLEDIAGEDALAWARGHNERTDAELIGDRFERMRVQALEVFDTDDRIPSIRRRGEFLYNFWRDAANPRGLWRRTTLDSFRTDTPDWDVLIDVDALAAAEDENWVWHGADVIKPDFSRAMIYLSRGGADATEIREFDMTTRQFVPDGFTIPAAKTSGSWEDEDTLLVGTDFGDGSLTNAGYPRLVKRWRRGQPLDQAETVFEGQVTDVSVSASVNRTPGFERTLVRRTIDRYTTEVFELRAGELIRIDAPTDATVSAHRQWLRIRLRTDWHRDDVKYAAGALLIADYDEFLAGTAELHVLFAPDERTTVREGASTRDQMIIVTMTDVASRVLVVTPGEWTTEPMPGIPPNTDTAIADADDLADEVFLISASFITPPRLFHRAAGAPLEQIKSAPAFFDADGIDVSQHFATSDDGTSIPYFLVAHQDSSEPRPTLLYGYGSYGISQTPGYSGSLGRLWLAHGCNYVVANIRGGGEYGPPWHMQAVRTAKHKSYEDFACIARDLVDRGVTTTEQLGADGGSAGGLLIGVMLTRYPELFGALVASAPLFDLLRYHRLLTGPAHIAEFGDPDDPAERGFLEEYSPYHNVAAGRRYPPILITTSSSDDRLHPGHARKMAAALEAAGHEVLYYENLDGGHAGAADNAQAARAVALRFEFLHQALKVGRP
jgi:prolyl oligopeptidase